MIVKTLNKMITPMYTACNRRVLIIMIVTVMWVLVRGCKKQRKFEGKKSEVQFDL